MRFSEREEPAMTQRMESKKTVVAPQRVAYRRWALPFGAVAGLAAAVGLGLQLNGEPSGDAADQIIASRHDVSSSGAHAHPLDDSRAGAVIDRQSGHAEPFAPDGIHETPERQVAADMPGATSTAFARPDPDGRESHARPTGLASSSAARDEQDTATEQVLDYRTPVTLTDASQAIASRMQYTDVIHITNDGDRIVLGDAMGNRVWESGDASSPSEHAAADAGSSAPAANENETVSGGSAQPDYIDVYPGCPRVLPEGSDEAMAKERQALYGCIYLASCSIYGDADGACLWYLTGNNRI